MEKTKVAVFRLSTSGGRDRYDVEGFMEAELEEVGMTDITRPGPLRPFRGKVVRYCGEVYLVKEFFFYYKDLTKEVQVPSIVLTRSCPRDPHEVAPDPDYIRP